MRTEKTKKNKNYTIHQLDSIYFGSLNNSYQKDGFGIIQTNNFQTYIGNWKNNKAQGIGLIIYPSGQFIYSQFYRDQPQGVFISDNKQNLYLGVIRNTQKTGIGYQYNYHNKLWKMIRYLKGHSLQVIKQQMCDINNSLPKILNIQQTLFFHLHNYLSNNYFGEYKNYFQIISDHQFQFGFRQVQAYGPGLKIYKNKIFQGGFYEEGLLQGYGFRYSLQDQDQYQFGCYKKGKKHGYFYQKQNGKQQFYQYKKNKVQSNISFNIQILNKKQKAYSFNCKDFLSAKNTIQFSLYKQLIDINKFKSYKTNQPTIPNKSNKKDYFKMTTPIDKYKKAQYILQTQRNKSSVQIMREKINNYMDSISGKKSIKQAFSKDKKQDDIIDIANEQNPFSSTKRS